MIVEGRAPKGDVFATARIAGIMAAKRTADLIPMCHPHRAHARERGARAEAAGPATRGRAERRRAHHRVCETTGPTGVEMEALTAAAVAGSHHLRHVQGRRPGHGPRRPVMLLEKKAALRAAGPVRRNYEQRRDPLVTGPGRVVSVNLSEKKTVRKTPRRDGTLVYDRGFRGRCARGRLAPPGLAARPGVDRQDGRQGARRRAGDFAENITTEGIDLLALPVGTTHHR
jgi:hypothetical protein